MPNRPVLTFPNPILKQKMPEMGDGDPGWGAILADLVDTMVSHPGCVGLAAPQIGHRARCLVADVSRSSRGGENHGLLQLVNPMITEASQWKVSREGCLSFPDFLANVKRAQKIRVIAMNEKKEKVDLACVGYEAVAIQHEIDHLDGILFLDRVRSSKDLFERKKDP
jgi:peptide deformylase